LTYGKYTTGGGSSLPYKKRKIFTNRIVDDVINQTSTIVWQDLCRMNLNKKITKMSVLNVGSGTEAIAFKKLGAKEVSLYDLSHNNIIKTKNYSKKNNLEVQCEQIDLLGKEFQKKKKKFDLIYLNGVIHHTKNPETLLKILKKKINKNGSIWLYVYQSGSIYNIIRYCQNEIAKKFNLKDKVFYKFINNKINQVNIEKDMDDIFCKYLNIFTANYYYNLIKKYNYKITFKKDFYTNYSSSIRLHTESFLLSIKLQNKSINKFKNIKIKKDYFLDAKNWQKEDKECILSFSEQFHKFINSKTKITQDTCLKLILHLSKLKYNYNYLLSYDEKKSLIIDAKNVIKKFNDKI